MADKIFNTRVINKHDTEENWLKATGFIPLDGEIIVYEADGTYSYPRFKVGDGTTNVNDLPFAEGPAQADWNQNNLNAPDYIKNRTHWAEDTSETMVPLLQDYTLTNGSTVQTPFGWYLMSFSINTPLEDYYYTDTNNVAWPVKVGDVCTVIYDNVTYICTVHDAQGVLSIGNGFMYNFSFGNEEPFLIGFYSSNGNSSSSDVYAFAYSTDVLIANHTITILRGVSEIVHKLDSKFIHTPNWKANVGEEGYIANRTHWSEFTEVTVVDNVSLTLTDNGNGIYMQSGLIECEAFNVGEEVTVIWDNVSYKRTVINGPYPYIGNPSIIFGGMGAPDTGEPFAIACNPNGGITFGCNVLPSSSILTIRKKTEIVHPINPKYLPDEALQVYTHPTYTARTGQPTSNATPSFGGTFTVSQITSNSLGHVTNLTNRTVRIPSSTATTSTAGLMSAADKTKLDGLGAPDWNQNDETAADYIKNRTHWEVSSGASVTLVNNVSINLSSSSSTQNAFTMSTDFIEGKIYRVTFNGATYECIAYIIPGPNVAGIGSAGRLSGPIGNDGGKGEPFLIFSMGGGATTFFYASLGTHTITIQDSGKTIYKLDKKYLPYDNNNIINGSSLSSIRSISSMKEGTQIGQNEFYKMGDYATTFGYGTKAIGGISFAEGYYTTASGYNSHAEGGSTTASGQISHAEGTNTTASGEGSHAEGTNTIASGYYSHTEGGGTKATQSYAHAEGHSTTASDYSSHAEGSYTTASKSSSHAEGSYTTASNNSSHAEGSNTTASGERSHAEGYYTTASGTSSHAEGNYTVAKGSCQHVQGHFNIEDTNNTYAHIVGNGEAVNSRSNAHTLDWGGNAWFKGSVYVGGTGQTDTAAIKILPAKLVSTETTPTINDTIYWLYE